MSFRKSLLWLFILNLGISFGAGLYESLVVVPHWLVPMGNEYIWNAEAVRGTDSGMKFWAFFTTGPLTALTLLNLFVAWRAEKSLRKWWLAAAMLAVVERGLTFGYFIPTMLSLMNASSTPEVVAKAIIWEQMNNVRHILNFAAWICALKVLGNFPKKG